MFKVTIKQYVKPLCALILIAAVLNSGCISTSSSNTAEDVPVVKAEPEKVMKTTPDGLNFFEPESEIYVTNTYRGAYDTDGDIDATDSAVGPGEASRHNNNIAIAIANAYGIQTDSKLYQDYPNIEEFRTRRWDLDGDGEVLDKIEIIINGEVVYTTITDTNQDGSADLGDAVTELGWK